MSFLISSQHNFRRQINFRACVALIKLNTVFYINIIVLFVLPKKIRPFDRGSIERQPQMTQKSLEQGGGEGAGVSRPNPSFTQISLSGSRLCQIRLLVPISVLHFFIRTLFSFGISSQISGISNKISGSFWTVICKTL